MCDRDAEPGEDTSFVIKDGDIGERDDPEKCIFARCAKQHMRADHAWFGKSIAYLELPKRGGGTEVVRFHYSAATAKAIAEFDRTGEIEPGIYQLRAVRPSQTIDGRHKRNSRNPQRTTLEPGSRPATAEQHIWHAPRGWGRGYTNGATPDHDVIDV